MNTKEIQQRLDSMAPLMADKAFREPKATILFNSQQEVSGMLQWREEKNGFSTQWSHHKGDSIHEILDIMDAWIAAQPTRDERKKQEFMRSLANTIDLGRASGIDVEFINPLTVMMKKLSENAITHDKE